MTPTWCQAPLLVQPRLEIETLVGEVSVSVVVNVSALPLHTSLNRPRVSPKIVWVAVPVDGEPSWSWNSIVPFCWAGTWEAGRIKASGCELLRLSAQARGAPVSATSMLAPRETISTGAVPGTLRLPWLETTTAV